MDGADRWEYVRWVTFSRVSQMDWIDERGVEGNGVDGLDWSKTGVDGLKQRD